MDEDSGAASSERAPAYGAVGGEWPTDQPSSTEQELDDHLGRLVKALISGRGVVPFLGAGVNLFERTPQAADDEPYEPGRYLPNGGELAQYLTTRFSFPPAAAGATDLLRVSQYVAARDGLRQLYKELHTVFDVDYPPTALHRLLAELPSLLERITGERRYQLILTTNYDDALERAFAEAGEPFDVVAYIADDGKYSGKFWHWPHGGDKPRVIRVPNKDKDVSIDERTVILKLHGAVDRAQKPPRDSYVITEDHYIRYLVHGQLRRLIPALLAEELSESHILFLGYGMRDWNVRALLHSLWSGEPLSSRSWSIQEREVSPLDKAFWESRELTLLQADLKDYVPALRHRLETYLENREAA
jgi:hypothetical protein